MVFSHLIILVGVSHCLPNARYGLSLVCGLEGKIIKIGRKKQLKVVNWVKVVY